MLQMSSGDVDRDPQIIARSDGPAPFANLAAGVDEHASTEFDDLPRFFGNRYEGARHHEAMLRVIPPDQRFDTQQFAMGQIDDRLELENELVTFQGPMYVLLQPQAMPKLLLHVWMEDDKTPLSGSLGVVHRDIRIAQQLLGVVTGL